MSERELEARIIELEIRHAQQQDLLEQLNQALVDHQKVTDALQGDLDRLRRKVESLGEPGQVEGRADERPPHY